MAFTPFHTFLVLSPLTDILLASGGAERYSAVPDSDVSSGRGVNARLAPTRPERRSLKTTVEAYQARQRKRHSIGSITSRQSTDLRQFVPLFEGYCGDVVIVDPVAGIALRFAFSPGDRDDVSGAGLVRLPSPGAPAGRDCPTSSRFFSVTILVRM